MPVLGGLGAAAAPWVVSLSAVQSRCAFRDFAGRRRIATSQVTWSSALATDFLGSENDVTTDVISDAWGVPWSARELSSTKSEGLGSAAGGRGEVGGQPSGAPVSRVR